MAMWGFYDIVATVVEQATLSFDTDILLWIRQWHTPLLDRLMVGISILGSASILLSVSLILILLLWRYQHRSERLALMIASVGAVGLNYGLKYLFARARPELWQRIVEVNFYSFPSGHAMVSAVVYGMLAYLLTKLFPGWRGAIATGSVALVVAIGFSRLYLGVHWFTDVVAGYVIGSGWLLTCILGLRTWQQRHPSFPDLPQTEPSSLSTRK
jgi:undecaprenyl-diphosphatase